LAKAGYVAKLLELTLLAPRIIEAVVAPSTGLGTDGDEPDGISIAALRRGVPARWDHQGGLPSA